MQEKEKLASVEGLRRTQARRVVFLECYSAIKPLNEGLTQVSQS